MVPRAEDAAFEVGSACQPFCVAAQIGTPVSTIGCNVDEALCRVIGRRRHGAGRHNTAVCCAPDRLAFDEQIFILGTFRSGGFMP